MTIIAKIAKVMGWLATIAGMSLSCFVFLSVVMRYFVGAPFYFTEELVGLLFCAMSFLSIPMAEVQGLHIRLELLTRNIGHRGRLAAHLFALIVLVCFCGVLFYHGFNYMLLSYRITARTDAADLLIYPWVIVILIAIIVFVFTAVFQRVRSLKANSG